MAHIATIANRIAVVDGTPTTTTLDIAEVYGKQHAKVLAIVRQRMAECPAEWRLANFGETVTERANPSGGAPIQSPVIRMTKKGFHFVVGKFTGAKAVQHQIAFADEFERMELALTGKQTPAIPTTITPAQQQDLQELVQLIVASGKQGYGETWRRFHNKFKVAKYDQLPSDRFDEAVQYLKGKLDADALMQLVSRHLDARIPLIVESVSQMVGTLAQDAMKQLILSDNLVTARYVSGFGHDRERGIAPAITPVRSDQNIMSVPEMLHQLEGGWFGAKPDQVCNALTALSSQLVRMSRTPAQA